MKKILLSYKTWIVVALVCGLGYVFLPLANVYLESKIQKLMVDGQDHPISEYYYNKIAGVTFINGNFLLFMTKPYMFHPGYGYIYSSSDAKEWVQRARFNFRFLGDRKTFNFPYSIGQKCFIYSGIGDNILMSTNCKDNWHDLSVTAPPIKVMYYSSQIDDKLLHCYNLIKHKGSLITVFSNQPPKLSNYDVFITSQIVPNYAVLFQTYDGVNWYRLATTKKLIQELVTENKLESYVLVDRFLRNPDKFPVVDFNKLIPYAYNLPCYPEDNLKAYNVLNKIVESNNLNIYLSPTLTTYGAGVYIGVFMDYSKYSVIKSEDGIHYSISSLAAQVTNSLAGTLYQSN
mgnify:CR=1 FL=1